MPVLMWIAGILFGIVALYTVLYWLARRRTTPDWEFDQKDVPAIQDLMPTLAGLTGTHIYEGNQARILVNGAIFDAMLEDIASARHSVHLETFVWWGGKLERRIADALLAAAARGAAVRVIVDGVGCLKRTSGLFEELEEGGVALEIFSPLTLSSLHRFNERTHRKLLIVDGTIGYTMGHGISDNWLGNAEDADHYRDTGVRVTGPIVHGLQTTFAENWVAQTCELLLGDGVFPKLEPTGDLPALVISSTAGDEYSHVELGFTLAISAAQREILIQNPYFAPDRNVVTLLCEAVQRGVEVTLMLPGSRTDSNILRRAARHLYPQLIEAGVRVLEYQPTLSHQKVTIVDGIWSRVGSTNLDCRSLELNDEAGLAFMDEDLATELREQFIDDAQHCETITIENCKDRSFPARAVDAGAYLLHGQL